MAKKATIEILNVSSATAITNTWKTSNLVAAELAFVQNNGASAEDKIVVVGDTTVGSHITIGPTLIPHTWSIEGDLTAGKVYPGPIMYVTTYRRAKVFAVKGSLITGTASVTLKRGTTTISTLSLTTSIVNGTLTNTDLSNDDKLTITVDSTTSGNGLSLSVWVRYY